MDGHQDLDRHPTARRRLGSFGVAIRRPTPQCGPFVLLKTLRAWSRLFAQGQVCSLPVERSGQWWATSLRSFAIFDRVASATLLQSYVLRAFVSHSIDENCLFRTLLAELLLLTGDPAGAQHQANAVLQIGEIPDRWRSRCLTVLANASAEGGSYNESLERIADAVESARRSDDPATLARSQLRALALFGDRAPMRAAALCSDLRAHVLLAADAHLSVQYHLIQGRIEARIGLVDVALRRLWLANALLQDEPNLALQALIHLDLSALNGVLANHEDALHNARLAFDLAEESGHTRTQVAALANAGLAQLFLGRVGEARQALIRALHRCADTWEMRIGLLDSCAQLYLAEGRLDLCEEVLSEIPNAGKDSVFSRRSWNEFLSLQTRFRLAMRRQDPTGALQVARLGTRLAGERF